MIDYIKNIIVTDLDGDTSDVIPVNGYNGLVTMTPAHICTECSTSTILEADETWTSNGIDVTNFGVFTLMVKASHDSATDGLVVEYSTDNTNWDSSDVFNISAGVGKIFSFQCPARYLRVRYTNGSTEQTYFRLQTVLKPYYVKPSSHRIHDTISNEDDAELTKAVLTAHDETQFVNIGATPSGNLKITDAENPLAIAKGEVTGASDVNKWGNAPDFDQADGEVTVWDGAEDGTAWELMQYVYPTSATIDSISSSNAGDTESVTIVGLNSDWEEVTQTISLSGQDRVALTTNLIRVYRAYNNNGTVFAGHVFIFENDDLTDGVPDTASKIKAVIHPENQQTEMAIFSIPAGKTGYVLGGYSSTAGSNKTSNYVIKFKARQFGKVFRLQQKISISDTGSSFVPFTYAVPQAYPEKTDLEVTAEMTAVGGTGASISAGFAIILIDN